jgi:hypothetical protein
LKFGASASLAFRTSNAGIMKRSVCSHHIKAADVAKTVDLAKIVDDVIWSRVSTIRAIGQGGLIFAIDCNVLDLEGMRGWSPCVIAGFSSLGVGVPAEDALGGRRCP